MNPDPSLPRRGFLMLGAGLLLGAACDTADDAGSPPTARTPSLDPTRTTPAEPTPSTTTTTPVPADRLPRVEPWQPDRGDVRPDLKLQAVRALEALGSWESAGGGLPAARARLTAVGADPALATQAGSLLSPAAAAALDVTAAQYGGLLTASASILVVCRQWLADADGRVRSGGSTVDVRLSAGRRRSRWVVTALHPSDPGEPAEPLSSLARQVLTSRRLELPSASRADVRSGRVHDTVLAGLLRLSASYRIGVSVVRSGHPVHVFGTTRVSDHTDGRAFDTFRIDDRLVVDPATPRALVSGYMQAAVASGAYNVGGPYPPDGGAGPFFTDSTHSDHVHIAFAR